MQKLYPTVSKMSTVYLLSLSFKSRFQISFGVDLFSKQLHLEKKTFLSSSAVAYLPTTYLLIALIFDVDV
jgi:hypothetical protein